MHVLTICYFIKRRIPCCTGTFGDAVMTAKKTLTLVEHVATRCQGRLF